MPPYWQGIAQWSSMCTCNYLYNIIDYRRMNLAAGDTVLWTVQTTLLGFTSLLPLKAKYNQVMKEAKD